MYEKEIKWLLLLDEECGFSDSNLEAGEQHKSIEAALGLMRAAEPKDEVAEFAWCMKLAEELLCSCPDTQLTQALLDTRASVRAEAEAEYKTKIEQLEARCKSYEDQEMGAATDCWQHEKAARAEVEAKYARLKAAAKEVECNGERALGKLYAALDELEAK